MMLRSGRIILLVIFILLRFPIHGQSSGKQTQSNNDFIANASVEELATGYLDWISRQPDAGGDSKPHRMEMPTLDVYSPTRVSLYFGANSAANADIIRKLPQEIPKQATVARPSLSEAIDMFHELKPQKEKILSGQEYTVFAVTYPNWDHCKEQNEAIAQLREHRQQMPNIRIVEVRLHK
jgi:hypothetical protein